MAMWDPFRELESLHREIDRTFGHLGADPRRLARAGFLPGVAARQYPLVNIHDDGDAFRIEALAPGLDPTKLDVSVIRNTITITGEKPGPGSVAAERIHRSERAAGRFVRSIELPTDVDPSRVTAEYRNGLLLLTAPRAESARPRRIAVQAS